MKKALVLLYPGCIYFEVALAANLLHYYTEVMTAAPGTEPIMSSGITIQPAIAYADVALDDFGCIIVPGGDPATVIEDAALHKLLQAADARGMLIAGICAGALVLASAGLLRGRQATHNYTPRYAPPEVVDFTVRFWEGLAYRDAPLVRDGHIITAQPYAHIDFALAIMKALDLYTEEKAQQLGIYHRGAYPF